MTYTEKNIGSVIFHRCFESYPYHLLRASQVVLVIKNTAANARDIRDAGSISESGRSP